MYRFNNILRTGGNLFTAGLVLMLMFTSCEYEFDVKGLEQEGRLFMLSIPGGADTTVVQLMSTVPIGNQTQEAVSVNDVEVEMKIDGKPVALLVGDGSDEDIPEGARYVVGHLAPGTEVEIDASVDGLEPVSAVTSVPPEFPEHEISVEKVELPEFDSNEIRKRQLSVTVSFTDDGQTEDYYGIQVCRWYTIDRHYDPDRVSVSGEDEYKFMEPYLGEITPGDIEISSRNAPLTLSYTRGNGIYSPSPDKRTMLIWDDAGFNGGEASIEFSTDYTADYDYSFGDAGYVSYLYRYKVYLYRLSPELYRFVKSNWIAWDSQLVYLGLASPSFVYTNVSGGLGVCGGISCTESPWFDNPE